MPELTFGQIKESQSVWAQAVIAQDIKTLMNLYANNAVLKPTLSTHIRRSPQEIEDYFSGGGKFKDSGFLREKIVTVEFLESCPILLGAYAIDTGKYKFFKEDKTELSAHFTFFYQLSGSGKVQILAHHSSADI